MMQHEFLRIFDERLVSSWGQAAYPQQNIELLWRYVKDISAGEFEQALDDLAMTVTRAPPIGQVRGACLPAIRRAAEAKKREMIRKAEEGSSCRYCGGHGWVYALSYENPLHEFAFLCHACPAPSLLGFTQSHGARAWRADDEHGFFLRYHAEKESLERAHAMQREASAKMVERWKAQAEREDARRVARDNERMRTKSDGLTSVSDLMGELPF